MVDALDEDGPAAADAGVRAGGLPGTGPSSVGVALRLVAMTGLSGAHAARLV